MTEGETKFRAFIDAITDPALRNRVEDSAFCNSFAVEVHDEYANDELRWQVALATAEECLDGARDYYPELFQTAPADIAVPLSFEPSGDGMAACIHDANGAIICEAKYDDFERDVTIPERAMKMLVEAHRATAA